MQESYRYGVASQPDPESCAGSRKAAREALTGEHAGRVLSRESGRKSECRRCSNVRKATPMNAKSRAWIGLCAVEDPWHAWKLHAREPGGPVNARHAVARGPVGGGHGGKTTGQGEH